MIRARSLKTRVRALRTVQTRMGSQFRFKTRVGSDRTASLIRLPLLSGPPGDHSPARAKFALFFTLTAPAAIQKRWDAPTGDGKFPPWKRKNGPQSAEKTLRNCRRSRP